MAERIPPRHEVLIERWLSGDLDEPGRVELAELLGRSAEARAAWWQAAQLHAHLRDVLSEAAGARSAARLRPQRRRRRATPRVTAIGGWALAAAAVVVVAIGGWWLMGRNPAPPVAPPVAVTPPTPTPPTPTPPTPPVQPATAAVLSDGRLLSDDGAVASTGAGLIGRLRADGPVVLTVAGGGRLRLADGTVVVADADPARPLRLDAGTVTADAARLAVVGGVLDGRDFTASADADGVVVRAGLGPVLYSVHGGASTTIAAGESRWLSAAGIGRVIRVDPAAVGTGPGTVPTLAAACTVAAPGDRIVLAAGSHRGGDDQDLARITLRATAAAPLFVTGEPGAVIEVSGWNGLVLDGAAHVVLRGLTVRGVGDPGGNGIVLRQATGIRVVDCRVEDLGGSGIGIHGGEDLHIEGCTITGCGSRSEVGQGGIDAEDLAPATGTPRLVVRGCHIAANKAGPINRFSTDGRMGGHGLALLGPATAGADSAGPTVVLVGNRLRGNDGCGLWLSRLPGAVVLHNTVEDNLRLRPIDAFGTVTVTDCAGLRLLNNLVAAPGDRVAVVLNGSGDGTGAGRSEGNRVLGGAASLVTGFRRGEGRGVSLAGDPAAAWIGPTDAAGRPWGDPPTAGAGGTGR